MASSALPETWLHFRAASLVPQDLCPTRYPPISVPAQPAALAPLCHKPPLKSRARRQRTPPAHLWLPLLRDRPALTRKKNPGAGSGSAAFGPWVAPACRVTQPPRKSPGRGLLATLVPNGGSGFVSWVLRIQKGSLVSPARARPVAAGGGAAGRSPPALLLLSGLNAATLALQLRAAGHWGAYTETEGHYLELAVRGGVEGTSLTLALTSIPYIPVTLRGGSTQVFLYGAFSLSLSGSLSLSIFES